MKKTIITILLIISIGLTGCTTKNIQDRKIKILSICSGEAFDILYSDYYHRLFDNYSKPNFGMKDLKNYKIKYAMGVRYGTGMHVQAYIDKPGEKVWLDRKVIKGVVYIVEGKLDSGFKPELFYSREEYTILQYFINDKSSSRFTLRFVKIRNIEEMRKVNPLSYDYIMYVYKKMEEGELIMRK